MPAFVGAKERTKAENSSLETKSIACHDSEITPLLQLGPKSSSQSSDMLLKLQKSDDSNDLMTTVEGSRSRVGTLLCSKRWIRGHLSTLAIIAATMLLALGVVYIGRSQNLEGSAWISLSPPIENVANIAALKEYLGSSLDGLSNAAVASDQALCSKIGKDIMLQKGGNAMDAAVATVLCLGVASPASSGLGGGAFLLVRSSKKNFEEKQNNASTPLPAFIDARTNKEDSSTNQKFITEVIDCREVAPEKSSRDMYTGLPEWASEAGGLSIAVPGEVSMILIYLQIQNFIV